MPVKSKTDKNAAYVATRSKRPQTHNIALALAQARARAKGTKKAPDHEPWSPENQ